MSNLVRRTRFCNNLHHAQTPKPCELCEAGTSIKFKCTDCSKFICERCRKIHSNVPTLAHHQIVEIKSTTDLHLIKSNISHIWTYCNLYIWILCWFQLHRAHKALESVQVQNLVNLPLLCVSEDIITSGLT
jgi:hypothetical protein